MTDPYSCIHELNHVLMAVQTAAAVLRRKRPHDEAVDKAVHDILRAVKRGERLSRLMLQPGWMLPATEPIALESWLPEFVAEAQELVGGDALVTLRLPPEPLLLHIDVFELHQALVNLVLNARDAMLDGGGTITIEVDACDTDIALTVRDNGEGISPNDLPHIFEPRFTRKRHGNGFGLTVVRQIVAAHRGTIDVESTPGIGTAVRMRFLR